MTPDVHSLEITGGEPLLNSQYIKEFLRKYSYKAMLETNATLPANLKELSGVIDWVSLDIKLPEHFDSEEEYLEIYNNELKSIEIMESNNMKYYIKIVASPTTSMDIIKKIYNDLEGIVSDNIEIIIQPVSPMSLWEDKSILFRISEFFGKHFNVSIIPQIHKYMDVE